MVDEPETPPEETPPEEEPVKEAPKPVQRAEQDTVAEDEDDSEVESVPEEGLPVESTR